MSFQQPFPLAKNAEPAAPQFGPDLAVRLICPECLDPNPAIVEEFSSGDLVCGTCGLVLGDRVVDTRSEWRTFANDEGDDPSRVGAATDPLLDGMEQLDTVISFKDGGSGIARELQRAASRGQSTRSEKNLHNAFKDIASWCDQFSLPKTISDIAKQLYKRADEEKLLRGKPTEAVVAACIFIACRQAHVPRSFKEICTLTHVSKKTLGQCYKALEQTFNFAQPQSDARAPSGGQRGPEDLVIRYCNQLSLPPFVTEWCRHIIFTSREMGILDGRSPLSVACGVIYFTCHLAGHPRTPREVMSAGGVSEGTIKLIYRILLTKKDDLPKKEWLEAGKADLSRLPPEIGGK